MTPKEALNNIATISEILVEVSKSHIMSNKAINEIRKLDIAEIYFTLRQALAELNELNHDVARYFALAHNPTSNTNPNEIRPYIEWANELIELEKQILSKVGKEE